MLNYEIDPEVLKPLVPRGTELDFFDGHCFVSIVGFLYRDTRIMGFAIPGHRNFAELNLRFYIRRWCDEGCRRGVAFVKEIVPRRAVAIVARTVYDENFVTRPMRYTIETDISEPASASRVEYSWWEGQRWQGLTLTTESVAEFPSVGSEAEFITEHYWGYTARRDGTTSEYRVAHRQWRIQSATTANFDCDLASVYGQNFADYLSERPSSAFLAEGSAVEVYPGRRLPSDSSTSAQKRVMI